MMKGRLGRYALWQFRDFATERAIAILIIGTLMGYLAVEPIRRLMGPGWAANPQLPLTGIVASVASSLTTLAVLIALNGMISHDRKRGYYRFLFAKPVSPLLYYAQLFLVHLAGVLAAMAVLTGLFAYFVAPFSVKNILMYSLVIYFAMGGIGFFISAATRFDWVTLAAVWVGSRLLRGLFADDTGLRGQLVKLLPPVHKVDGVAASLLRDGTAPLADLAWLVGYGALFFVLGLVVLRQRSLAA